MLNVVLHVIIVVYSDSSLHNSTILVGKIVQVFVVVCFDGDTSIGLGQASSGSAQKLVVPANGVHRVSLSHNPFC